MHLKKSVKRKLIFLLIIILICVGVLCYFKFFDTKKARKVKVIGEIKEYSYQLKDSKSKLYKDEFKNLEKILAKKDVDEEEYAKSISKLFIIDFFSLSDKLAKTDVGGSDFVHSDELTDFLEKAEDTFYKYVESKVYGGRTQKLPTVDSVKINSITKDTFKYNKTNVESYVVKVSWTYSDEQFDSYQKSATLTIIHQDKKLVIVEME